EDEREKRFRTLFNDHLDVPAIGKFVAGRYWRSTNEQDRSDFLVVFEDVMVQRFLPIFAENSDLRLMFGSYRKHEKHEGMFVVNSILPRDGAEDVRVSWIVRYGKSDPKVLDILVEGTSMALTLRSEYSSFLKKNGKKLANLTASLREKVNAGAFQAKLN
ncbi:MAG: ABC transporter substrate-binding protein, partial [Rubricoccaceae bacterium]|nr:ABC transporter substrate-binding protein [Rubricoccaceae bacterium]